MNVRGLSSAFCHPTLSRCDQPREPRLGLYDNETPSAVLVRRAFAFGHRLARFRVSGRRNNLRLPPITRRAPPQRSAHDRSRHSGQRRARACDTGPGESRAVWRAKAINRRDQSGRGWGNAPLITGRTRGAPDPPPTSLHPRVHQRTATTENAFAPLGVETKAPQPRPGGSTNEAAYKSKSRSRTAASPAGWERAGKRTPSAGQLRRAFLLGMRGGYWFPCGVRRLRGRWCDGAQAAPVPHRLAQVGSAAR
jgi:hypothetical protein